VTSELPRFNFFDMSAPVFSRPRFLPGSKINGAHIDHAVVTDGCIINPRGSSTASWASAALWAPGSELNRVILLGCDYYESQASIEESARANRPRIGVGANTRIDNAIIDKNARIGDNVVISPAGKPENVDHPLYFIRDGIVIIPKNGVVPHGTVI
jgi:glucose-1-phosphate adenylyltransferase